MNSPKRGLVLLFFSLILFEGCPPSYEASLAPPLWSIWLDSASNQLYVGKGGSIFVFNDASTANGNVSPARVISTTGLTPQTLWLDSASNQLYVGSIYTNSILVFTDASTVNGNVSPARVISTTGLATQSLWLDSASNQLYVGNIHSNSILVFTDASMTNGSILPARIISGTMTESNLTFTLWSPTALWLDPASDQLYVGNVGGISTFRGILVFTAASIANGSVSPARVISTTTGLSSQSLWLDPGSNQLYVSAGNGIAVYNDASTTNGNVSPARVIISTITADSGPPVSLWLDSTSDQLYEACNSVSHKGKPYILVFDNASTINGYVTPSRTIYP